MIYFGIFSYKILAVLKTVQKFGVGIVLFLSVWRNEGLWWIQAVDNSQLEIWVEPLNKASLLEVYLVLKDCRKACLFCDIDVILCRVKIIAKVNPTAVRKLLIYFIQSIVEKLRLGFWFFIYFWFFIRIFELNRKRSWVRIG